MPKNIIHDIIPSEGRSIRQIPINRVKKPEREPVKEAENFRNERVKYESHDSDRNSKNPNDSGPGVSKGRVMLWSSIALLLVVLAGTFVAMFSYASVKVLPKNADITLNHTFTASNVSAGGLTFAIIPLEKTAEVFIPATEIKRVSERASGTITIYNEFSDKPQRLIKNTRFENPSGFIYRVDRSVVVPGKTVSGGKTVPGTVDATVYADSPGEEFNGGLFEFTIPGFKNDKARYSTIYAKSKTSMTGGIDGNVKVPTDESVSSAKTSLKSQLNSDLRAETLGKIDPESIFMVGAFSISFEDLPIAYGNGDKAKIAVKGRAAAYSFNREELETSVAGQAVPDYENEPITMPGLENIGFTLLTPEVANPASLSSIQFRLSGTQKVVWEVDNLSFARALQAKPKAEISAILKEFPSIEKIDVTLRPFWKKRFPSVSEKIKVEILNPETAI